jgi:biotin transport system substrate-specific component
MPTATYPNVRTAAGRAVWIQYGSAAAVGSAVLALSAHVQVSFWPVRLSMQSFVVLAIGLIGGRRVGTATVLAYLVEGALGLPVFQSGAGLTYIAGPTGGYLLGFLLSVIAVGTLTDLGAAKRRPGAFAVLLLGVMLIYLPGVAWLAVLFGPAKSIAFGLTPFLPAEACKLALVVALAPVLQRRTV